MNQRSQSHLYCLIISLAVTGTHTLSATDNDSQRPPADTLIHTIQLDRPVPPLLSTALSEQLTPGRISVPAPIKRDSTLWFIDRKALALCSTLAFSIPIVVLEYQWWWREDYQYKPHAFHFQNDGWFNNYSLGVDKCGHFFTSYMYFSTFYDLMRWADYSESTSRWTAFAVPAAHAISVELCDGFSRYSFSANDLIANFLGIGYAYAQTRISYLHNFNPKWSYYPAASNDGPSSDHGFAADYTGHTYWLSINMKGILPESISSFWPRYLNIAIGYGASNVSHGEDVARAQHKFCVALDYNLSALPIVDDTWALLIRFADRFHFPAPGIKTYTGGDTEAKPVLLY